MRNPLLSISLWLIQHISPSEVKDDISGDLEEEYTEHVLPEKGQFKANFWLLKQTLLTCSHHIFTYSNGLLLLVALMSISVFCILTVGISWLSNVNITGFSDPFWQDWLTGASHKTFFHPAFWQYMPESYQNFSDVGIWLELHAILYSTCALYSITKINKIIYLNIKNYALLALVLMFIPYIWGTFQCLFNDLVAIQVGPIVATMWLTIWYMILPISYQVIKKIRSEKSTSSRLVV